MKLQTIMLFVGGADRLAAARDWYRDRIGLPLTSEESRESVWFETGGLSLGLHVGRSVDPPGNVHLYLEVPDVHEAYQRMSANGVTFQGPPEHRPWGATVALTTDPVGHAVFIGQSD